MQDGHILLCYSFFCLTYIVRCTSVKREKNCQCDVTVLIGFVNNTISSVLVCFLFRRKCAPLHTIETQKESGVLTSLILNLRSRWKWVVRLTPRPLYLLGKNTLFRLSRRMSGPKSRCLCFGERKTFMSMLGSEPGSQSSRYTDYTAPVAVLESFNQ